MEDLSLDLFAGDGADALKLLDPRAPRRDTARKNATSKSPAGRAMNQASPQSSHVPARTQAAPGAGAVGPKPRPGAQNREERWVPIDADVEAVLSGAEVGPTWIRIARALEPNLYQRVNQAIERLGGKWKRTGGATQDGVPKGEHRFAFDPAPLLALVLERVAIPPQNPTAFFPTPRAVAERIVEWAAIPERWHYADGIAVLEPSAGHGAIADAIRAAHPGLPMKLTTIELLPTNAAVLRTKGYDPLEIDFLDHEVGEKYTAVLMNPPFSAAGAPLLWLDHVEHAYSLLHRGGVLVAVVPDVANGSSRTRVTAFCEWVYDHDGEIQPLNPGTFKNAGTMANTSLVFLVKDDVTWKRQPFEGFCSWHAWNADMQASTSIPELYERRRRIWAGIAAGRFTVCSDGTPEPPLHREIKRYYEIAQEDVNEQAGGPLVRLTDEDHDWLGREFVARGAPE